MLRSKADNAEKLLSPEGLGLRPMFSSQLEEFESPDAIFSDYAYFSSFSTSWVEHARRYCEMMVERFGFDADQPGCGDCQQRRLSASAF